MEPGNNDTELGGIAEGRFVVDGEGNGMDENGLAMIVDDGLIAYDVSRDVRAEYPPALEEYIGRVCDALEVDG